MDYLMEPHLLVSEYFLLPLFLFISLELHLRAWQREVSVLVVLAEECHLHICD